MAGFKIYRNINLVGRNMSFERRFLVDCNFLGYVKTLSSTNYSVKKFVLILNVLAIGFRSLFGLAYARLRLTGSLRKMSILLLLGDRFFPPARYCCSLPEGI
jgi:hypothetical protein